MTVDNAAHLHASHHDAPENDAPRSNASHYDDGPAKPSRPTDPRGSPSPRLWVLGVAACVMLGLTFALGIAFGYGMGRSSAQAATFAVDAAPSADAVSEKAGVDADCPTCRPEEIGARAVLSPSFESFWEAMDLLYRDFYGELPAPEQTTYSAIQGVLGEIDDPHTSFLPPQQAEYFRSSLEGSFEGIGARVGWNEEAGALVILEPFANQPAWNAGLRRQDLVLEVDGESIVGTDLSRAIELIRGPKDTEVQLTVQRDGGEPFGVTVVRDRIEVPTISTDSLGDQGEIAYIRLTTFNENAGTLVREAVNSALERNPEGLILDLRGNGGGLLREAVKITSIFLEDEVVLLERFSDGEEETYKTAGNALTTELPMVVLVDGASASASEIVAGALQDTGRATVIGETTFGKGSVQRPHTLSDGAILRVTVARWHTPQERTIEGTGLRPDVVVDMEDGALQSGDDPQLEAARKHLQDSSSRISSSPPAAAHPAAPE